MPLLKETPGETRALWSLGPSPSYVQGVGKRGLGISGFPVP